MLDNYALKKKVKSLRRSRDEVIEVIRRGSDCNRMECVLLTIIKAIPGIMKPSLSPVIVSYHGTPGIINERQKGTDTNRVSFLSIDGTVRSRRANYS